MNTNGDNVYAVEAHDSPPEEWYGHDLDVEQVVTVTYKCNEAGCNRAVAKMPDGTFRHVPKGDYLRGGGDWGDWKKERRKAAQEGRLADAKPYAGAIAQCQAGVTTNDRASVHYRCAKKPRYIVDDAHGKPMAVCGVHARDRSPSRYHGRTYGLGGRYDESAANEPLEEEYL